MMTTKVMHRRQDKNEKTTEIANKILLCLFKTYKGAFKVELWDNSVLHIGKGAPSFTLNIRSSSVLRDLVLFHDPIRLAEAYFNDAVGVSGDFYAVIELRHYLENLKLSLKEKLSLAYDALALGNQAPIQKKSTKKRSGAPSQNNVESIAFHYDVSNAFYKLWLDRHMVYSCAYFESPDQSLEIAQCNKLDYICRKLRLKQGEYLLDIGCGWGALVCWAAKHYGVRAHGITLSSNQFEYANEEVKKQGLGDQVTIELHNYRDLPRRASYDKVSSIGMFEHVGLKNLSEYFTIVHQVLKPGGLFLNHGITTDKPDWSRSVSTKFINRHVFPDGELDTVSNIQRRMEETKFEIFDVEGLRPHYALTLRHWVKFLEQKHKEATRIVGEHTYRVWRLYMAASALQFEQGKTGVYQILAERKHDGIPHLPLTRRDLYRPTT